MRTFEERFAWVFETRSTNPSELSEKAGLSRAYIRNLITNEKNPKIKLRPGVEALDKIARAANVSFLWLFKGIEPREPYVLSAPTANEPTPPTPPTGSGPRVKMPGERGDHWFPDHVEDMFNEVLQSLGEPRYTPEQVRAAKVFIRDSTPLVAKEGPRKLVLGALEVAQELDKAGESMIPPAILARLIEKNAPISVADQRRRAEGQAFVDKMQAAAEKRLKRSEAAANKAKKSP